MFWEELNVNDFAASVETCKGVCLFPMGCLEKHGNHLPLGTDILLSREVAARAAALEEVMIFPSYPLGIVAEVKHKAGTIAVSSQLQYQVLEAIFDEIARNGFKKILIVNGHGGSTPFLNYFTMASLEKQKDYIVCTYDAWTLSDEQEKALVEKHGPIPPGGHADLTETSQIMAIRPDLTHMELVVPEESQPLGRADWYSARGVQSGINWYASYPHQFAGDPTAATPEFGEDMLNLNAQNLAEIVKKLKEDDTLPALFAEFFAAQENPQV